LSLKNDEILGKFFFSKKTTENSKFRACAETLKNIIKHPKTLIPRTEGLCIAHNDIRNDALLKLSTCSIM